MNDYEILLSNGRDTLRLAPDGDGRLLEGGLDGIGCAGFDVKIAPLAAEAGGYAQRRRFAEREITVSFEVPAETASAVRRRVIALLDPTVDLELSLSIGGENRVVTVIPDGEAVFSQPSFLDPLVITVTLLAPSVFLRDQADQTAEFRSTIPLFTFPLNTMEGAGTVTGFLLDSDEATVDNPGDAPCGVRAVLRAVGGSVVRPGIACGEKTIRCPLTLEAGDELVIDTHPRQKNITLNGERTFVFERDSDFFEIPVGRSSLSVLCDSGAESLIAEISFTPLYFGM